MSAYVATFFGGILFSIFVAAVGVWWLTRGEFPQTLEDCPHCDGTGMVVPAEDRPVALKTGPQENS